MPITLVWRCTSQLIRSGSLVDGLTEQRHRFTDLGGRNKFNTLTPEWRSLYEWKRPGNKIYPRTWWALDHYVNPSQARLGRNHFHVLVAHQMWFLRYVSWLFLANNRWLDKVVQVYIGKVMRQDFADV
jgi:hypothetical protein